MASENANNQSVERAAALLKVLTTRRPEMRASDLAAEAGLGLSTASRLLATLESLSLVERDPVSSLYRLGPLALAMGGTAANQSPVYREARQLVQNLAARVQLGVNVAERRGDRLLYLHNAEGPLAPRAFTLMGQTNPLHATGIGKCLLSGLTAAERRELLPGDALVAFTSRTLTTHEQLDAQLAELLARGYATESEELALGRACIAAPIRDRSNTVVAAVSISGQLSAIDLERRQEELGRTIIELADTISTALGYSAADLPYPVGATVIEGGG